MISIWQSFISNLFQKKRLSEKSNSNILSWQRHVIGENGYCQAGKTKEGEEGGRREVGVVGAVVVVDN